MKRKIIALLMATVCTTAVFASCGDESSSSSSSEKPACEKHVDANKDAVCDECEKAVVVITEQLPAEKEEEVPMVVNPIPENVKLSDYIGPKADALKEDIVLPKEATTLELAGLQDSKKNLHLFVTRVAERDYNYRGYEHSEVELDAWREIESEVVKVYDASKPAAEAVIFEKKTALTYKYYRWSDTSNPQLARPEFVDSDNIEEYTRYSVTLENDYVKVVETVRDDDGYGYYHTTYKTALYTHGWNLIATAEETFNDNVAVDVSKYGGYTYLTMEGKTYTLDNETGEKVTFSDANGVDKDMIIRRPDFDVVNEDYGYVLEWDGFKVYDLSEWVSCATSFTFPSYWNNPQTVVLDDGTVFVQYEKTLHSGAVSYDVLKGDEKIDLVQVLINPVDGTMETVEFGYALDTTAWFDADKYNDNAKNIVYLKPIEDKEVNDAAGFEAVIDNELNILFAYKPTVIGQDLGEYEYIADGLYKTEIDYDENVSVRIFVDGEGKEVKKLPASAEREGDMWVVGTKYYSLDMSKVLLDTADYDQATILDGYVILKKVTLDDLTTLEDESKTEYFYFAPTMNAPVSVSNVEDFNSIAYDPLDPQYFIVTLKKASYVNNSMIPTTIMVDKLYNKNNELVASFENESITNVEVKGDNLFKVELKDLETNTNKVVWLAK